MRPSTKYELSEADFIRFSGLVHTASGLVIPPVRRKDLEEAVWAAMEEESICHPDVFYDLLTSSRANGDRLERLAARLTVGETHFFRNKAQFQALENHILPELIARNRETRRLRIWSAGCASGEEPYSLAILLHRLLPDLAQWNILLLATDINRQSLEKAQRGLYGSWSFREVPPGIQETYFTPVDRRFELSPAIRKMVTFAYLNLIEDRYPSLSTNTQSMDLIFCRNVLIYFNEASNRLIVERLYHSLRDGGWLIVGHTEPSQTIYARFKTCNFPGTTLYQKPLPGEDRETIDSPSLRHLPPALPVVPARAAIAPVRAARPKAVPATRPALPETSPADVPREIETAQAWIEAGQTEQAFTILAEQHQKQPDDPWPPFYLARICADRLELQAAEDWIRIVLAKDPLMASAHYLYGMILQEGGRLQESLKALRASVYADAGFIMGHYALGGLYLQLSQPKRALKSFRNVENLLQDQPDTVLIPEGDGLTAGRLMEFVETQKGLLKQWHI
jgi:chemotaxis protein methyltransferase CheR